MQQLGSGFAFSAIFRKMKIPAAGALALFAPKFAVANWYASWRGIL
jgi:hypothetical protein